MTGFYPSVVLGEGRWAVVIDALRRRNTKEAQAAAAGIVRQVGRVVGGDGATREHVEPPSPQRYAKALEVVEAARDLAGTCMTWEDGQAFNQDDLAALMVTLAAFDAMAEPPSRQGVRGEGDFTDFGGEA